MPDIQHTLHIAADFDKIFQYFNTKEGLRQWWTPDVEGEATTGGLLIFGFGKEGKANFRVIENMPPEYLKWKYEGNEEDEWYNTEIIVHLSASGGKVKVVFQHNGYANKNDFYELCDTTWKKLLQGLEELIEGGESQVFDTDSM
jgi:uncharacterized protein YndB with AHSA1/START domain